MKKIFYLLLLSMLVSTRVLADWDPESEAREQAQREAEQRADQERKREAQLQMDAAKAKADKAMMDSKRETLGSTANGKSDAEVNRLYDAKITSDTAAAYQGAQQAREALSHGQGAEAVKDVTGKSMQEIENMSDEELDALSRDMENKYGQ